MMKLFFQSPSALFMDIPMILARPKIKVFSEKIAFVKMPKGCDWGKNILRAWPKIGEDSAHAAPILKPGHIIACLGCTDCANAFVQGEYGSDDDDAKFRKEAILNFLWEKKNGG